jgi:orotate phosphoribosyltransferase
MLLEQQVLDLLAAKKGHFVLESGHHGDLWLELELLFLRPRLVEPLAAELAARLSSLNIEVVCGPLVEGAFLGLLAAAKLDLPFSYSERYAQPAQAGLFPAGYRIPQGLRTELRGKRVAIINDVINAGSAVRGTFLDLQECSATVVAIGALLVLGTAALEFAASRNVPLESLAALPNNLWTAAGCPLCAAGVPLEDPGGFAAALHSTGC